MVPRGGGTGRGGRRPGAAAETITDVVTDELPLQKPA